MQEKQNKINRRNFLKTIGAAGVGAAFILSKANAEPNEPNDSAKTQGSEPARVPKRKLGKTGAEVSCLGLGVNVTDSQIILRNAFKHGVTYWDTANSYQGGNSEIAIGKFLSATPQVRKELFIVTKASGAKTAADVEKKLATSLKRMNTDYIDLYHGVHGLANPGQLTDELKQWVQSAKQRKLIHFFGFSTHKNMAQNLKAAAKLGWVDAVMTSYNFRLMQDAEMQDAIEACHKAGIGIIAMKTVALSVDEREQMRAGEKIGTEEDKKFIGHFLQKGFTEEQARIKAVLQDERISSACVGIKNTANLVSNVAAVLDETKLSQEDVELLKEYAAASCGGYCAGCAYVCDNALPNMPYVSDIMRYLMYYNSYGEPNRARQLFAQIPQKARNKLLVTDYGTAEALCPQHLPIAELIAEAVNKLA